MDDGVRITPEVEVFLRSARGGETVKCQDMLKEDPKLINSVEAGGFAALHFAAFNNDLNTLRMLVEFKPDLNIQNYDGNTPLMLAAKVSKHEAIRFLVEAGADVNFATTNGVTAAHHAAGMGATETIALLVELGHKLVRERTNSGSLLHWAAHSGNLSCVGAMLYDYKMDINGKDEHGGTPLFTALFLKKSEVVQFLLEHGANPNAKIEMDNATPLHIAVEHAAVEDVKLLLAFGADQTMKDNDGDTPNSLAEKNGKKNVLKELTKAQMTADKKIEEGARLKAHGNKVFAAGENVKAAKFYTLAISLDPKNHVYFSNRAACNFNVGNLNGALFDSRRCVDLNPQWPRGYFRLATTLNALKRTEEALAILTKGLQLDPSNKDLLVLKDEMAKHKK